MLGAAQPAFAGSSVWPKRLEPVMFAPVGMVTVPVKVGLASGASALVETVASTVSVRDAVPPATVKPVACEVRVKVFKLVAVATPNVGVVKLGLANGASALVETVASTVSVLEAVPPAAVKPVA